MWVRKCFQKDMGQLKVFHTDCTCKVSLQCAPSCVLERRMGGWMLFHTGHIHRVFLRHASFHVFEMTGDRWRFFHIAYIHKASLQCESFHAFSKDWINEGFPTLFTFIGLLSRVCYHVPSKSWGITEGFPHSLHLCGVSRYVISCVLRCWGVAESFPTFHTLIGLLSSVCYHVSSKSWGVAESFPTLTLIWFLSSMSSHMTSKTWKINEGFPTLLTFIGFLAVWILDMPVEGRSNAERFFHIIYIQRPFSIMDSHMRLRCESQL